MSWTSAGRCSEPGCEGLGSDMWFLALGVTMGIAHDRGARAERAAARLLGGVRTGNRGTAAADVTVGDWAVVEVKSRQIAARPG